MCNPGKSETVWLVYGLKPDTIDFAGLDIRNCSLWQVSRVINEPVYGPLLFNFNYTTQGQEQPGTSRRGDMEAVRLNPDLLDAACATYFTSKERTDFGAKVRLDL